MNCYNCRKDIADGSRYCYLCGASQRATTPLPPPREPGAPLRRSRSDKMIGGVCSGFARHFGWEVSLTRVIWASLAVLTHGIGFIVYLICWIVIPMEEVESIAPAPPPQNSVG